MPATSRRHFLASASAVTAGFIGLRGHVFGQQAAAKPVSKYGPLIADPNGILDLPKGFSYKVIATTGEKMVDGLLRPGSPDGMGAFAGEDGRVILVCNHELAFNQASSGAFGKKNELLPKIDRAKHYSFAREDVPYLGGTTTMVYDPNKQELVHQFLSLSGTDRNCAGGPTPWGSWVTCEEPAELLRPKSALDHGYAFDVPASEEPGLVDPVPLKAMGRFRGEAVAVDPKTGIVYQSEDRGDGILTRFIPTEKGALANGGALQTLIVKDKPSADTRNWSNDKRLLKVGESIAVEWKDVADPSAPKDDMRLVEYKAGAALFARAEGMWHGEDGIYFACTNGGPKKLGQIFRLVPGTDGADDTLELFVESPTRSVLEACDNVTIAPWGDLVVCEDGGGDQFVRIVTKEAEIFTFARNASNSSEFCGACFAPDHPTLFVNIQKGPGLTLAVTGPWGA